MTVVGVAVCHNGEHTHPAPIDVHEVYNLRFHITPLSAYHSTIRISSATRGTCVESFVERVVVRA